MLHFESVLLIVCQNRRAVLLVQQFQILMEFILQELERKKCWKSFLKTQCRRNKINPMMANTFTIVKMRRFYEKLVNIEAPNRARLKSSVWLENELKAYHWLLVGLSGCKGILIQNFGQKEWRQLSSIFNKQESILEYEGVKLISEHIAKKRKWEEQEIQKLEEIIKDDPNNNRWNEIARKLFDISSKKYFRTGKQCRERWLNHLDPSKKHGQWESTEDRKIVKFILENGKKWSQISKMLESHRTEHMVKNRFKTLTIRLRKKYKDIQSEKELLSKFFEEVAQQQYDEGEQRDDLDINGLPVLDSGRQEALKEEADKYPGNFRESQIQQVVTPCPIIYQTFTPTFLNTPNSLTFLMNYSFDQFEKNQNLFLKNS